MTIDALVAFSFSFGCSHIILHGSILRLKAKRLEDFFASFIGQGLARVHVTDKSSNYSFVTSHVRVIKM